MFTGGKKIQKTVKTKFRDNRERDYRSTSKQKSKQHDKSTYRLIRNEENDYVL